MTDTEINILITYCDIVGNWLTMKILTIISKSKQPVDIKLLKDKISSILDRSYYREKLDILNHHGIIDENNVLTDKGKKFLKLLNSLLKL